MIVSDLKLRRLHAALAVFETGSSLKAAESARLSQPAVATALAALEKDLDARLFERTARGMSPTEEGRLFCARLQAAFDCLKTAESELQALKGEARPSAPLHRLVTETQLRALSAMVEAGGFSDAARRLGLAQPIIHRAARDLEQLCGVDLWRREGPAISPTPAAHRLARQARLFHHELESGLAEIRELQGRMEGALNIGALPLARARWLPGALASLMLQHPDARVRIVDGPYPEQLGALLDGRIDFILGALRDPAPQGVIQEWLFDDPLVILVRQGHPLARDFDSDRDKLTPDQLGALAWVLPHGATPARQHFEDFMALKGLEPPARVIECSSVVATRALLLDTDYAAVLSRQQVEIELDQKLLKVMGPPLTGSHRPIGIAWRQSFRPTRLQGALLDELRSQHPPEAAKNRAQSGDCDGPAIWI